MMAGMSKDIASGVIILGGVALVIVAAEASLPIVAGIGAIASAGTGLYQALSAPKRKRRRSAHAA
jgi:hypothetical protein